MAERLHLTIGEVLSLLREEFPDVSISKIRFLESQGLVEPERTPSGYRKFYDHDVERLRWILRQQREHFLPLKVIRGRLTGEDDPTGSTRLVAVEAVVVVEEDTVVEESAVVVSVPSESEADESAAPDSLAPESVASDSDAPDPGAADQAPAMNGAETFGDAVAPETPEPPESPEQADRLFDSPETSPDTGPRAPASRATRAAAAAAVTPAVPSPQGETDDEASDEIPTETAPVDPTSTRDIEAGEGGPEGGLLDETLVGETVVGETVVGETVVGEVEVGESEGEGSPSEEEAAPGVPPAENAVDTPNGDAPNGSEPAGPGTDDVESDPDAAPRPAGAGQPDIYSVAEIAEAVGCTPQLIRELQQFGILVAASDVGGKMYFDPDAVGLARVGARFAELGVEPRHLRTWRNAADREASLFEQLVMPLLRQRNPQSRRQAAERLDELSTLGSQLRAGLLAEAVRGIK